MCVLNHLFIYFFFQRNDQFSLNSGTQRNKKLEYPLTTEERKDEKDIDLMNLLRKIDSDDEKAKPLKIYTSGQKM